MIERSRWLALAPETALVLSLFFFYLWCFDLLSVVHGPYELFAQDSVYIVAHLKDGGTYPWNPQSHLLYHLLVDRGHDLWQAILPPSPISSYRYLKLFTGLCGLAFLAAMRQVFVEIGLALIRRLPLLLLSGISISAWFHFAAFETHCLAMPALGLYLLALVRMTTRPARPPLDRVLLIGSLLVCGWTRIDLFRLTAVTVLLLVVPSLRSQRRSLALDLALVVVLGVAGNAALAGAYLDPPIADAVTAPFERDERDELEDRLGELSNLSAGSLVTVGRAISLYSIVMPVERRPAGRSFLAPATHELNLPRKRSGALPSTDLFLKPARHLCESALSLLALAAAALALACALALGVVRALTGAPLQAALVAQAIAGWLFYTWFNPFEPFLWIVEFLPIWMVLLADLVRRGSGLAPAAALWALAVWVGLHNSFAFYLPFR